MNRSRTVSGDDAALAAALDVLRARVATANDPEAARALERVAGLHLFQTRILEAIANGVITLSPGRRVTSVNDAARATFGLAPDALVGGPASALGAVLPELDELLDTFFESGAVQLRAEVDGRRSDGSVLTVEVRLAPLLVAGGTGAALVVTDVTAQRSLEVAHAAEIAKAARIQESFSRYLAPHVVRSLMHDSAPVRLGGERSRATMFFADVRGFTSMAARLGPERVVEILNAYFEVAVRVVFAHDGLLDKFYGDGLMAVFGPPRVRADDAARAVRAAIALHEAVRELGPRIDYPLEISLGLATGDVVAGHFGSTQRMDYTVIGDAVNLASGLQNAAPPGAIYADAETIAAAGTMPRVLNKLSTRIKGRSGLVTAYALFPHAGRLGANDV